MLQSKYLNICQNIPQSVRSLFIEKLCFNIPLLDVSWMFILKTLTQSSNKVFSESHSSFVGLSEIKLLQYLDRCKYNTISIIHGEFTYTSIASCRSKDTFPKRQRPLQVHLYLGSGCSWWYLAYLFLEKFWPYLFIFHTQLLAKGALILSVVQCPLPFPPPVIHLKLCCHWPLVL